MARQQTKNPGRPRDEHRRVAVLDSALLIASEQGLAALSFESIAKHSNVGRPLLYRWWPNKAAILIEALLRVTEIAVPYADTGRVETDVQVQVSAYAELLRGPHGNAYRVLFGEAQRDPDIRKRLYQQLAAPRRRLARAVLKRGVSRGQLRKDLNIEAAVDLIFAPLLYRLLLGHASLRKSQVDVLVQQVMRGMARI
jgi:AcrR family transcriptional regulator